jgi:hypothetical protein
MTSRPLASRPPNRIKRTALTLALHRGVSEHSAEVCLQATFDEGRSPAFQSDPRSLIGDLLSEKCRAFLALGACSAQWIEKIPAGCAGISTMAGGLARKRSST